MIPPNREQRLDLPVFVTGIVVSAALALGGGFALAGLNRPGNELGPTAATLTDAWNIGMGAGLGLLAGSAIVALAARHGSRAATGAAAGGIACLADVVGFTVATRPADVSVGDEAVFVVLASVFELVPILIGATAGAFAGAIVDGYRTRASGATR